MPGTVGNRRQFVEFALLRLQQWREVSSQRASVIRKEQASREAIFLMTADR
jgi:hypothetical protein